jgi:hypothetical protein
VRGVAPPAARGMGPQARKHLPPGLGSPPWRKFVIAGSRAYTLPMPRKPIELPPAVARRLVEDVRAFFAEENPIKRNEIAGRQMSVLRQYQGPREKPVRIPDIKERDVSADEGSTHDRLGSRRFRCAH